MSAAPKLTDERVREILCGAIERNPECLEELAYEELEALAQAVIDLRTANKLLEAQLKEFEG